LLKHELSLTREALYCHSV